MTDPSSYVFYPTRDKRRIAGNSIQQVTVTDRKITVSWKKFFQSSKSSILKEEVIAQRVFKLCFNRSGEPFLKVWEKLSREDRLEDFSLGYYCELYDTIPQKIHDITDKAILQWFQKEGVITKDDNQLQKVKDQLLFPVFRDPLFWRNAQTEKYRQEIRWTYRIGKGTLERLQDIAPNTVKALQENKSWSDFLKVICPHTVKKELDGQILLVHQEMIPLAAMMLGRSISELHAEYENNIYNFAILLERDDSLLDFMFAHLTSPEKEDALGLCQELNFQRRMNSTRELSADSLVGKTLKTIPPLEQCGIAKSIYAILKSTLRAAVETPEGRPISFSLAHSIIPLLQSWYWENVTKHALQTPVTLEQVEQRFSELFGRSFREEFSIHPAANNLTIIELSSVPANSTPLSRGLIHIIGKEVPKAKAGASPVSGFYMNEGNWMPLDAIHSLEDVLHVIEEGVVIADASLRKLNRKITPKNRVSYLSFPSSERQFKNTWRYYDLGITDLDRILALKQAKIHSKEDIIAYGGLPDEMFKELVQLRVG